MKWWLISDETVEEIRGVLDTARLKTDYDCVSSGCACDIGGQCLYSRKYRDALHSLSALQIADSVPKDYSEGILKDILRVVNTWHEVEKESMGLFHKPPYSAGRHVGAVEYLEKVQKLLMKYIPEK